MVAPDSPPGRDGPCEVRSRLARAAFALVAASVASVLAACTPTFDWREARPAGGLTVLFPCKPDPFVRRVALIGAPQPMSLWSCAADGATFAVSMVEAREPAEVPALLQRLQDALAGNLGGPTPAAAQSVQASVPGATPQPLSKRLLLRGRAGDGQLIEAQGQFFSRGTLVFQATVLGRRLDEQAIDTFFSSLKFAP